MKSMPTRRVVRLAGTVLIASAASFAVVGTVSAAPSPLANCQYGESDLSCLTATTQPPPTVPGAVVPATTTTTAPTTAVTSPPATSPPAEESSGVLPFTGIELGGMLLLGCGLVGTGVAFSLAARRKADS